MKKYTGDFETVTWLENETYVWAWSVCEIENINNIQMGGDIDGFMEWCEKNYNTTLYFHNLRWN